MEEKINAVEVPEILGISKELAEALVLRKLEFTKNEIEQLAGYFGHSYEDVSNMIGYWV